MEKWIKGTGVININNGVRIATHSDICRYYQWHIHNAYYKTFKTRMPAWEAHITIVNPKIHKITDYSPVKKFHMQKVEFFYKPEEIHRSNVNFWMPASAAVEKEIKYLLQIKDDPSFWGLHLTISNTKY